MRNTLFCLYIYKYTVTQETKVTKSSTHVYFRYGISHAWRKKGAGEEGVSYENTAHETLTKLVKINEIFNCIQSNSMNTKISAWFLIRLYFLSRIHVTRNDLQK